MGETQVKGDLANAQAIATFTRLGYNVCIPITESASYDLVVEKDTKLYRVQVKYCGSVDNDVSLKRVHSNSKGYVVKHYDNGFEWLYVYRKDGQEYLFTKDLSGRSYVRANKDEDLIQRKLP